MVHVYRFSKRLPTPAGTWLVQGKVDSQEISARLAQWLARGDAVPGAHSLDLETISS